MLLQTAVLLGVLTLSSGYSCSNRLYRGQRLNASQFLCSRNQNYRMLFDNTGHVQINEPFPRETSFRPPPQTLFTTSHAAQTPSYMTFSDSGDFTAVATDGTVYWRANVSGADFIELQNTGIAVLFAKNASTVRVLWKSPSTYSMRLVGGGSNSSIGRLEYFFNNTWGSITTDYFDVPAATAACHSLGFDAGQVVANSFGPSPGPVWIEMTWCYGNVEVFQECPFGMFSSHPTRNYWGVGTDTFHNKDVAVSCQGGASLGVLPLTAHACQDRLYVGQKLSLGDALCAGPNGEYMLRFTNRRLDTVIELWYKWQMKWMMGMKNQTQDGAELRLDSDGVMRIVGNGTGLPYSLFSNTTANASFVELQDNGVVRVVSATGSTGWRKAPDDFCFVEMRYMDFNLNSQLLGGGSYTPLGCLDFCSNAATWCRSIYFNDHGYYCITQRRYPWDPSITNTTYYEKTPGCPSGLGCYRNYSYDRFGEDSPIVTLNTTNGSDCAMACDSTATCVSAFFTAPITCQLFWRRYNETVENLYTTGYYMKLPCSPLDPSLVPLLPVKDCPTKLLAGSLLLSRQYLCSPNGKHVLTVERDGRLSIDGGKWMSNSANSLPGYLQYTASNQLFLRLDDGTTVWQVDPTNNTIKYPSAGYLTMSDDGRLQMFSGSGSLIWDYQSGFRLSPTPIIADSFTPVSPGVLNLVDNNNASCASGIRRATFSLTNITLNATFNVVLAGRGIQCADESQPASYAFDMAYETVVDGQTKRTNMRGCRLLAAAPQECRFECRCSSSLCGMLILKQNGCDAQGDLCEVMLL